ncbi:MAG TPA: rhomboid family intramembrane serine protease [Terriglobales bacterium]|nr:rhomboid family intramembrane serine protease [Terriglobales bacterium]
MSARTHVPWFLKATVAPEVSQPAPPAAVRVGLPYPKTFSVALVLVVLNCAVFLAMVLRGVSWLHPESEQLVRWGACYGPLTLQHEWWRLLTATFVHIGIVHLALNMWCLWELGKLAESLFDKWSFLLVYLMSGIAGEITSVAIRPRGISAGASGAIFGLTGALIAALWIGKLPVPREQVKETLRSVLLFAGYNLIYGQIKSNIDNAAHVGGLVCGFLIGAALSQHLVSGREVLRRLRIIVFIGAAVVLFSSFTIVRQRHGRLIRLAQADEQLQRGDVDGAIRELRDLSPYMTKDPTVHALLGQAYLLKKQYDLALPELQRAVQLNSKDAAILYKLGWDYMALRRFEEAQKTFAQFVQLAPKDAAGYTSLGMALGNQQRWDEAIIAFQKAAELAPFSAQAYYDLGVTYMYTHRFDDAVSAFQQVVRLKPREVDGYVGLGNAYLNKGMRNEAADAFRTAAELRQKGP